MSLIYKDEVSSILQTAFPLVAAFLAQKGMQLIDTVMMGWIGPDALAAGVLGTSLFGTILIFSMGTLSVVGIYIARSRGANKYEDVPSNLHHGIYLALLLSLPGMLMIWYTPHLLILLGEPPLIVENTTFLIHGLVWGFPGFLLFFVFREFVSAFALTRIVMLVCIGTMPITFFANYILMYGKYGFPALCIAGIGYAGALIMWLMFACLFFYSKKHRILKSHMPNFKTTKFEANAFLSMIFLGAPTGLMYLLDVGMFSAAAILMGHFGVNALAAHQIALQCATIAYAVPFALSMATALQVGHAMGANDLAKAKRFTFLGIVSGLMIAILLALVFLFMPNTLVNIFLDSSAPNYQIISQLAIYLLAIAALFQCVDATQAIMNGALRGFKDTFVPMVWCIGCYWVLGIGSSYYLAFYTPLQAKGIWYGLIIGITAAASVLSIRFFRKTFLLKKY